MTRLPSDAKQPDDLRPYRASIRRVMREQGVDSDRAALICAARVGKKHIDDLVVCLQQARDQVQAKEKEGTRG